MSPLPSNCCHACRVLHDAYTFSTHVDIIHNVTARRENQTPSSPSLVHARPTHTPSKSTSVLVPTVMRYVMRFVHSNRATFVPAGWQATHPGRCATC